MDQKTETRYVFTPDELKRYFVAAFRYGVFRHMKDPKQTEAGYQIYQPVSLCENQWREILAMEEAAKQTLVEVA